MAGGSVGARLVVAVVAFGALATFAGQPARAQRDGKRSAERVQPPTELLKEYPLRQGRLRSRDRTGADERAPAAQVAGEAPSPGSNPWAVIAPVLLGATLLLVLGIVGLRVARATAGGSGEAPPPGRKTPAPRSSSNRFARGREAPRPENTYAVVNQKGGVGKTTVSLTLGAAAVRRGRRVLLVDLDPQASATSVLGADGDDKPTMSDVMAKGECTLAEAVRPTSWGLDLAPADRGLRSADSGVTTGDQAVLLRQLETAGDYDLTLIDCPPSLGTLTISALTATSGALVVTEPTFLAMHAMEELLDTLRDVTAEQNRSLKLAGVVLNRVETTAEHKQSVAELENSFRSKVLEPHVPKRAILQDAMRRGVPPQDLHTHSHYASEIDEIFNALAVRIEGIEVKSQGA
jgi:chromosome partitioning protein